MIVTDELDAWVRDRARQRETQAAIDTFAAAWRDGPIHQHFEALIALLPAKTAASLTRASLDLFASDAWVDVLVDRIASAMRADPWFLPPFAALKSEVHGGLLVYEDDHVQIAAGVSEATQLAAKKSAGAGGSINFNGQVTVLKFVRAGGATVSFWEAPRIGEDFAAPRAGTCRQTGRRRIADGESLVIDGRAQSYVIEHATSNLLVLQAAIKADQAPLAAEYDAASGAYIGCSATDDAESRLQMIATLVRKLGHREAFAAIAPLADHPRFFVRWHAMRELLGIDALAALPRLRAMAAKDPHEDVRKTARAALDQIEQRLAKKEAA